MRETVCDEVVAEFIRVRGITRCPTACVSATQGSVGEIDRAALEEHAIALDRLRRAKYAARARPFHDAESLHLTAGGHRVGARRISAIEK